MISLYSHPEPQESVPKDKKVLNAILAPKIMTLGKNIYKFVLRMFTNKSKQEKGIDFDFL